MSDRAQQDEQDAGPRAAPDAGGVGGAAQAPTLVAVVGPTASGKSDLGVALAERLGAEVLALDSMLVYRGMDVGTARLSADERRGVPHHLEDLVEPTERYDVQRYLADARAAEAAVRARGRLPIFVGGTGLYLKALVHGLFDGPAVDLDLRARLAEHAERVGPVELHRELLLRDPELARRLHPNDTRRVLRGLEVLEQTGRPLSHWQQQWASQGRPAVLIGLAPEPLELDRRIAQRTRRMLERGLVAEVEGLLARGGFGPTAAQALGYAEVVEHLAGRLAAADLESAIALHTRQFARRQRTWYRNFEGIHWLPDDLAPAERIDRAVRLVAGV